MLGISLDTNLIPDWVFTTVIGVIGFGLFWLNRQRLGLGEVQLAEKRAQEKTATEQSKVIDLQERQIELLNAEVRQLKHRVEYLENVVEDYQRQVAYYMGLREGHRAEKEEPTKG